MPDWKQPRTKRKPQRNDYEVEYKDPRGSRTFVCKRKHKTVTYADCLAWYMDADARNMECLCLNCWQGRKVRSKLALGELTPYPASL
jgi:hypothetical protein